jgi:C4-type Zn-finger protein
MVVVSTVNGFASLTADEYRSEPVMIQIPELSVLMKAVSMANEVGTFDHVAP